MAYSQGQHLPLCYSCNTKISGRTNDCYCRNCDIKYHPGCVRGLRVGTCNKLKGSWQCRVCSKEQTSAAAGRHSGARVKTTHRIFPSEVLLDYLKKKNNVKVLRNVANGLGSQSLMH